MKYNKEHYVGKRIQLYPSDSSRKFGTIVDVDDLGWTVKITSSEDDRGWKTNSTIFISHSTNFRFAFI